MSMREITAKQEIFLQGLMEGKSQRQAYIAAYPAAVDWQPSSVDSQASNLLKMPKVSTRYEELKAEARALGKVKREDILAEVSSLAFSDVDLSKAKPEDILKTKMKALDILIRMLGYDQPEASNDTQTAAIMARSAIIERAKAEANRANQ